LTATLQSVKAKVSADLKSAYATLLFAQDSIELTSEILRRRDENLRLVELRFESGRENKGSLLLAEAYRNQARYNDLQAGGRRTTAVAQLAQVLGNDALSIDKLVDGVPTVEPLAEAPQFIQLIRNIPQYRQILAREDAAQDAKRALNSPFLPSLDVSGNVGYQGADFFPDGDFWSVGASLSFPFFNGGRDWYNKRSASWALTSATAGRENIARQLLADLKQNYSAYVESIEKVKVDESFQRAALMRAEIARKKYNNGLLSFEDWDLIENDLIARQTTYLQSKRDRVVAEASWEEVQGVGVIP
jgi:outer membrane protein